MRNPLHGHPTWRQLAILSLVLPTAVTFAILAFAWPAARLAPRGLPVGVVGTPRMSQELVAGLSSAHPGAFDLRLYADVDAVAHAVKTRALYGAFVMTPGRMRILDASAAGPSVAQLLSGIATSMAGIIDERAAAAGEPPIEVATVDVAPLPPKDARGVVFSSALLPLTICSIIVASAVGLVVRFRPAWRQLLALSVVAAVAGLGTYLVAQGWLGVLPNRGIADWASLSLTILALSAATAGLIALVGALGLAMAAALFVFIGNPFSGITSAPQMLPAAVDRVGQWLPPGAGANLLRSSAYFDGNGAGGHVGVLLAWVVAGFAAIIVGHHAPIRFAAARWNGTADTAWAAQHSLQLPAILGEPLAKTGGHAGNRHQVE